MSITASTTTLNRTDTRRHTFFSEDPFPIQTKAEFLADLQKSEDDIKHGRVKEANVVMAELSEKYGL